MSNPIDESIHDQHDTTPASPEWINVATELPKGKEDVLLAVWVNMLQNRK